MWINSCEINIEFIIVSPFLYKYGGGGGGGGSGVVERFLLASRRFQASGVMGPNIRVLCVDGQFVSVSCVDRQYCREDQEAIFLASPGNIDLLWRRASWVYPIISHPPVYSIYFNEI